MGDKTCDDSMINFLQQHIYVNSYIDPNVSSQEIARLDMLHLNSSISIPTKTIFNSLDDISSPDVVDLPKRKYRVSKKSIWMKDYATPINGKGIIYPLKNYFSYNNVT